jgi:hypothetical protein
MLSLPLDIYRYLFTCAKFRLRNIISLTMVSKKLRTISLEEENWYIISDTEKVLYDFTHHIMHSTSNISYPFNQIQQMRSIDDLDSPDKILNIPITNQDNLIKFYKCFPYYQVFHMDNICLEFDSRCQESLEDIHILSLSFSYLAIKYLSLNYLMNKYMITEIIMLHNCIDCKILVKHYSQIEKLEILDLENVEHLKKTHLKYLCVRGYVNADYIMTNLPDTIESLIILNGYHLSSSVSNQLNKFQYLHYIKFGLACSEFLTTAKINTVHFITQHHLDVNIDVPNVKNIIVTHDCTSFERPRSLCITSQNAVTCQIMYMGSIPLSSTLPNCPEVITLDYDPMCGCTNVFC